MQTRTHFVSAPATTTELPGHAFDGLMSIDSIQFIDAGDVTREIARLLRPGGRAVITTWESLTKVPLETVVPDYRPYLEAAGLLVRRHEVVQNARERELQYYNELLSRSTALREEIGAAAEPMLNRPAFAKC